MVSTQGLARLRKAWVHGGEAGEELYSHVSVAYLICSPLHVLMNSWTWENSVSKSGMFGMENFTNLSR